MKFFFGSRKTQTPTDKSPDNVQHATGIADNLIRAGNESEDSGDVAGALTLYEQARDSAPDYFRTHLNIGNALLTLGRISEAVKSYRQAIQLSPDSSGPYINLANALVLDLEFAHAAENYRMAIQLRPDWSDAWFGLGRALEGTAQRDDAAKAYEKALQLDPGNGKAAVHFAELLKKKGDSTSATQILDATLEVNPDNVPALCAQAEIMRGIGRPEAAVDLFRRALALEPLEDRSYSSFLFTLNFLPAISVIAVLEEHRQFANLLSARTPRMPVKTAIFPNEKLKIGYLSPDFRRHPVACFVESLLRHHDRAAVEVHCYYNHPDHDEVTQRFAKLADKWHEIAGIADEVVAQKIAQDGIDILVDLAGHTEGNRLAVFARKPAPLQVAWLGYLCTTGLTTIDYRLCDFHTDPRPEAEGWQTESPLRLPDSQWCYRPQVEVPDAGELPRLRNGYWTFGSLNQASKLNDSVLSLWAALLREIPDSRLRLGGIDDALCADRIRAWFAEWGVSAERLTIAGRVPIESYFAAYRDIDIGLDPFPYNGGTTTCDSLLMGVPVATVAGNRSVSRGGVSLLTVLGMEDWIADSAEDFVPIIVGKTKDPAALAILRRDLPQKMRTSALMDGLRFTRNVERIFRAAWTCSASNTKARLEHVNDGGAT